jgi:hypothetical protein
MNLYTMMSAGVGGKPAFSFDSWPSETFITDRKDFWFNGEAVEMIRIPAAYSDADLIVHIRKSDVVVAGDIYVKNGYPVIDIERGGSINGLIAGLNQIIDITVPEYKQEGGTMVIPGHGRLSNEADVVDYRDMVTIIRDRIQDLIGKGRTLDQVKATRPTLDYDGYYGSSNPSWTSEKFIEAVYRSLSETGRTSSSR